MNCRTHEHRHFERTLRSTDTIPGPRLAEGCSRKPKTACVAYRCSSVCLFSVLSCRLVDIPPSFVLERFRVGGRARPSEGYEIKEQSRRTYCDVRAIVGRSSAFVAVVSKAVWQIVGTLSIQIYKIYRVHGRLVHNLPLSLSVPSCLDNPPSFALERFRVGRSARRRIRTRAERTPSSLSTRGYRIIRTSFPRGRFFFVFVSASVTFCRSSHEGPRPRRRLK